MTSVKHNPLVGVIHPAQLSGDLKRELLMFDRIVVCNDRWNVATNSPDVQWLRNQGIVVDSEPISEEFLDEHDGIMDLIIPSIATVNELRRIHESPHKDTPKMQLQKGRFVNRYYHIQVRITAVMLRLAKSMDAVPVIPMTEMIPKSLSVSTENVIRIAIQNLPVPDPMTDLEQIVSFRRDEMARNAAARLRRWMSDVAKREPDPIMMENELTSLLGDYEEYLHVHKISIKRETLEAIVVSTLEIASDLAKMNWGSAAKGLFAFFKETSEFTKIEQDAPGREVAYISKARSNFGAKETANSDKE